MPANRSRTTEWRRCLRQVHDRGGSVEIAIANCSEEQEQSQDLVWRVRLLDVTEYEIIIEQPNALGQPIPIEPSVQVMMILSIGQNRWMGVTANLGQASTQHGSTNGTPALRLAMPESIQRCQRRHYYRVETTPLTLPQVEMWPLLDPRSVLVAERACEIQAELENGTIQKKDDATEFDLNDESMMPEVGPKFTAILLNLGGGGVGLRVTPPDDQPLVRHKLFWIRIALPPMLTTPICATGKLAHTHMESNQDTYAGLAFDFSFNPSHQRFVVDQISRYIALQQRAQLQAQANEQPVRKVA